MPTAEVHVTTERASRYLVQLCEHLNQIGQHHGNRPRMHAGAPPPQVQRVEWSDSLGTVTFDCGHCTVQATPEALSLRVEASDAERLLRMQDMLALRLETIGRRDGVTVTW